MRVEWSGQKQNKRVNDRAHSMIIIVFREEHFVVG